MTAANHRKAGPGHPPLTAGRRPLPCEDDPELFWPVSYAAANLSQITAAKALCRQCPAQVACLQWAVPHERDGRQGLAATAERVLREAGAA